MAKIGKTTAQELDQEIANMTLEEQDTLSIMGSRILKGNNTDEGRQRRGNTCAGTNSVLRWQRNVESWNSITAEPLIEGNDNL